MKTAYFEKKVLDSIPNILTYWDRKFICRYANRAFTDWYGMKPEDLIDKLTAQEVFGPLFAPNLPHWEKALQGETQQFKRRVPLPDGTIRHALVVYVPDIIKGKNYGVIVQVFDITYQQNIEDELIAAKSRAEFLATHDHLTGLLNRVLLVDRIEHSLLSSVRSKTKVAVCMMDIDNFKFINDSYGHQAGDEVLRITASRFSAVLRDHDSVARLGGDEFVILLTNFQTKEQIESIIARIFENLSRPIQILELEIVPSFSVGIAIYPNHGLMVEDLLKNSDEALYKVKNCGKNGFEFYAGDNK